MRKIVQNKKAGFTLIELMIVVAILGILAAVAIPAFATYVRRSKTSEVYGNLEGLFKAVSAYYNKEFMQSGAIDATQLAHCGIQEYNTRSGAGAAASENPSDVKVLQPATVTAAGTAYSEDSGIGFNAGSSYYVYGNSGFADSGTCAGSAGVQSYTLVAYGDLDNDDTNSQFSLATQTNPSNEIYKAGQTFIVNELE